MCYRIAGIDVHKRMLAVVVADVANEGDYEFERRQFGANPDELRRLADWLVAQNVQEVVMESTAQYWRPVWNTLERYWSAQCRGTEGAGPMSGSLLLALAQSNRGPRGRKRDFVDAERLSEATGRTRISSEFCARRGATCVAHGCSPEVSAYA